MDEKSGTAEKTDVEEMRDAAETRKPYTLKLRYPVQFGSETISELVLNRPTVLQQRRLQVGVQLTFGDYVDVAALLCKRDVAALNLLDVEDGNRLVLAVSFFLSRGLPTGGQ